MHLCALRAQLLHLNPSHWKSQLQFHLASQRENRSCSQHCQHSPAPAPRRLPRPAVPTSGKCPLLLSHFQFSLTETLGYCVKYLPDEVLFWGLLRAAGALPAHRPLSRLVLHCPITKFIWRSGLCFCYKIHRKRSQNMNLQTAILLLNCFSP